MVLVYISDFGKNIILLIWFLTKQRKQYYPLSFSLANWLTFPSKGFDKVNLQQFVDKRAMGQPIVVTCLSSLKFEEPNVMKEKLGRPGVTWTYVYGLNYMG